MHLFRSIDAAGSNQRTFLLLFSLLFRPQNRLTPQHEKIARFGNVFVLWGANLGITGGVNLVTKCKSVHDGICMKSRAIHHTCWLTSSHSSLITHHSSFTTNKTNTSLQQSLRQHTQPTIIILLLIAAHRCTQNSH